MHAKPAERLRPDGRNDGWFDALYPHLHRVACVAAPADVDPDDLVQDALVNYLQLDNPDTVRSPKAFLTTTIVITVPVMPRVAGRAPALSDDARAAAPDA